MARKSRKTWEDAAAELGLTIDQRSRRRRPTEMSGMLEGFELRIWKSTVSDTRGTFPTTRWAVDFRAPIGPPGLSIRSGTSRRDEAIRRIGSWTLTASRPHDLDAWLTTERVAALEAVTATRGVWEGTVWEGTQDQLTLMIMPIVRKTISRSRLVAHTKAMLAAANAVSS